MPQTSDVPRRNKKREGDFQFYYVLLRSVFPDLIAHSLIPLTQGQTYVLYTNIPLAELFPVSVPAHKAVIYYNECADNHQTTVEIFGF